MRPRVFALSLIVTLVLVWSRGTIAGEPRFKVIVHPDNPVTSIDRDHLRNAFLKKAPTWSSGETIRPVDLSTKFPVREQFTRKVLKKTPAQLKAYWNQRIFSGKGVPPPSVDSAADVIEYVLAHPGAVGYLPINVDPGNAKVVGVE